MNFAFQIGRIAGIPVRLHLTFLLIIPWVAYIFGQVSEPVFGKLYGFGAVPEPTKWVYSLAFAILLFACVGLHELGHSFIARRYGIAIRSITLYLFGGVASMEEIPRDPRMELQMAVAGPLVSGLLGLILIVLYTQIAPLIGVEHPFSIFLWTLGVINLILMGFNLLPAFPMDGGRVLRAWFATWMPYVTATRRAAAIGKIFAFMMTMLGLFSLNILVLIVGLFIYMGASEEERITTIDVSLEGIRVKNIMSSDPRTVGSEMTLRQLMDIMFQEKHRGYPVVDGSVLTGIVTITDLLRVPEDQRESTTVEQVMTRKIYVIEPEDEASAAMKKMTAQSIRRLPVLKDNRLVGIISREDLVRAIELCSERGT